MMVIDAGRHPETNSGARAAANRRLKASASLLCLSLFASTMGPMSLAMAESMSGALAKSYGYSPDLNQQRAATRAADETVPRATAGWRPTVTATSTVGAQQTRAIDNGRLKTDTNTIPRTNGVTVTQTLYNGGRTGKLATVNLHVAGDNYGVIEDVHQSLMHLMGQFIRQKRMSAELITQRKF